MANNGDGWSDDVPMPWPTPDGEAGGPWVDMVRKAAGSAGVSMLSAPFGTR